LDATYSDAGAENGLRQSGDVCHSRAPPRSSLVFSSRTRDLLFTEPSMSITPIDIDGIRTKTNRARVSKAPQLSRESPSSEVVQWFLDHFWIRHPISEDTIAAYRADLITLERWLAVSRNRTLVAATKEDLRVFLDSHYRVEGRKPDAVPSLSCIKRFYFYLVEVGLRADDPTERVFVRTPRLVRHGLTLVQKKGT
jgi:hypothetical protein